jgi:hypothetical protein
MIYITGDVHCRIQGNWEQEKGGSELDAAIQYLDLLKACGLKCTLFLNGQLIEKEPEKISKILEYDVELGGHTYDNFGHMNLFKSYINRKIFRCIYGSKGYQQKDIKKTKAQFDKIRLKMLSWRTHAFSSNDETCRILNQNGVSHVSDLLGEQKPFKKGGIINIPINIPVDVTTVEYGEYAPGNMDPFASCTKGRIKPREWLEIVKKRITYNEKNQVDSILLIHPITMKVLDDFKIFKEICEFLSDYNSEKISSLNI